MHRAFRTFIGVDLGGGKGKTTAVARLRLSEAADGREEVIVEDYAAERPWYDERLVEYLIEHARDAVLAIDAPLTLPACVRCTLPICPGLSRCEVDVVRWFRERKRERRSSEKPAYTPYTQRVAEVLMHEELALMPREALGQGMGPLAARGTYLRNALRGVYTLNHNLLEVYPRATLAQLFPDERAGVAQAPSVHGTRVIYRDAIGRVHPPVQAPKERQPSHVARHYKRSGHALKTRETILRSLSGLRFGPGQWQEFAIQNDHQIDAILCAYTAFLWARDGWKIPADPLFWTDGWIWFPPRAGGAL